MVHIVIHFEDGSLGCYPLGWRTNVIGRAESVSVQLLDSFVSRKHIQIRYDDNTKTYYVLDMNSTNGVFVNGCRIRNEAALKAGDKIHIGRTDLVFNEPETEAVINMLHCFKKIGEKERRTCSLGRMML